MKKEKLNIIYEDKDLIVVSKKAGLLTISNAYEKENTLYHQVSAYLKKKNKHNKVFIVHRLDKDTSGLVIFAKNQGVKKQLQDNWPQVIRKYYGIVKGKIPHKRGKLITYLKENKTHYVYETTKKYGKYAELEYETLGTNAIYSLLDINIKTGRKHQIRVQLNNLGYPLVGDKIYAKKANKGIKRLYLHAYYLEFIHPVTKEKLCLKIDYPREFESLISIMPMKND